MKNFGPLMRISFSLTCLTLGIVLTGDTLVGLSSGSLSATAEYRKTLSEALAVQYSHLAGRNHSDTIQAGLDLLIERNPQILSVAIQLASSGTFAQAGDHQRHWTHIEGGHSSIDHIQVPIFKGDAPWGTLQIAFQPVAELENPWSFVHPWSRLILFVAFGGFVSYLLFIKRTLRHLDPSAVIPARVKHALDVLAQGVVMLDRHGSIVLANTAFAKGVGLPLNDLIGSTLSRLAWVPATPSTEPSSEPWTMALNTRTAQADVRMVLADSSGKSRHFLVSSAPIVDESERLRGAVVSFDDVTQLEEANVALGGAVKELERSHAQIVNQNSELDRTNQSLVVEIDERKKAESEREALNRRLQEASRRIGMAEVAASVLHNVGNVLNSVNVSVGLIQKTLERTPVGKLGRIGQMFQDHMTDLSLYLTQDEKGKQIPSYVVKLADQLNTNFTGINKELDSLDHNIDHIRRIIMAQQGHAKTQILLEQIQLTDVVEQALAINRDSLEKASITVVREYAELPTTMCDRHQVLQIMVNLINNAIYAMQAVPDRSHRLTVTIGYHSGSRERVQIQVDDTGMGIAPDNFKRLFTQGFTTREDGQGLGLHSSSLAAKLLGGVLSATSEGEGLGATFTLDLPLTQATLAA
ncbi:MAG: PAS domain-containing protein [Nitrospira sp. CG24B]|nr:MAG: PAS domain-containing protein [Nitrospira sp. CG24B]